MKTKWFTVSALSTKKIDKKCQSGKCFHNVEINFRSGRGERSYASLRFWMGREEIPQNIVGDCAGCGVQIWVVRRVRGIVHLAKVPSMGSTLKLENFHFGSRAATQCLFESDDRNIPGDIA